MEAEGATDLFHRNHMRQITHITTAKFFIDSDTQQSQIPKLFPHLIEIHFLIHLRGDRRQFCL